MSAPSQQPLPPCHRHPDRLCPGECQYIAPAGICLHDMPGYWMAETSGVLRPAVEAYLLGRTMTQEQIAAMRAYLRQWIAAPHCQGISIDALRQSVDELTTRDQIDRWIEVATNAGLDPL